jgi:hypothetical protein
VTQTDIAARGDIPDRKPQETFVAQVDVMAVRRRIA